MAALLVATAAIVLVLWVALAANGKLDTTRSRSSANLRRNSGGSSNDSSSAASGSGARKSGRSSLDSAWHGGGTGRRAAAIDEATPRPAAAPAHPQPQLAASYRAAEAALPLAAPLRAAVGAPGDTDGKDASRDVRIKMDQGPGVLLQRQALAPAVPAPRACVAVPL
jgi:hypothetical protein